MNIGWGLGQQSSVEVLGTLCLQNLNGELQSSKVIRTAPYSMSLTKPLKGMSLVFHPLHLMSSTSFHRVFI